MYLVEVSPFSRGIHVDSLTYFSSLDLPAGSLVSVPVRSRLVPALVIESRPAESAKAEVRRSSYPIKKLAKATAEPFLPPAFLNAVRTVARTHATSIGATLHTLLPSAILEKPFSLPAQQTLTDDTIVHDVFLLQDENEERLTHYRRLIREMFAHKRSVLFLVPTIHDAVRYSALLERGIESYTYLLHSDLTKKTQRDRFQKAVKEKHPVLIVATPAFLSIPRHDVGLFILEHEASRAWRTRERPYLDTREVVALYAKERHVGLVYGDLVLSVPTLRHFHDKQTETISVRQRLSGGVRGKIIDMRRGDDPQKQVKDFHGNLITLSDPLMETLEKTVRRGGRAFLLTARRGSASITVCGDCGETLRCRNCNTPLRLYQDSYRGKKEKEPFFLCGACGAREKALTSCRTCTSWKLTPLGIGIERVEQELLRRFPETPVIRLDRDSVKNEKEAQARITRFYATPGAILLGTEMALGYLDAPVEMSAVVSFDSLFSNPDITATERIFSILLQMSHASKENLLVQTRMPEQDVLLEALAGDIIGFYRREIGERETYGYPPFVTLVKISRLGKPDIEKEMKELAEKLAGYTPALFETATGVRQGLREMHILLKIPQATWPDEKLLSHLRGLPPSYTIRINPESVVQ